jgi:hypothetical protein
MSETTGQAAEQAAAENAVASRVRRVDLLLAQWTQDCIHDSPAAHHTDAYNHLTTHALPELARRLLKDL